VKKKIKKFKFNLKKDLSNITYRHICFGLQFWKKIVEHRHFNNFIEHNLCNTEFISNQVYEDMTLKDRDHPQKIEDHLTRNNEPEKNKWNKKKV
jgi:hypothetical protein